MNWNELRTMNWDDLRIIQAVRDEGSYSGAAATLRLDEATVSRRLAGIERTLGVTLFEAVDGVRKPTASCELVASHIEAIARHVAEIGNVEQQGPVGRLRVASINSITEEVLAPGLPSLLIANPGLTIELVTSSERANFSRWEADLAVRLRKPERGDFAIEKLVHTQLYFFEPVDGLNAGGPHLVCCYPERLDRSPETEFLKSRGLQSAARCITDNARVIRGLIQSRSAVGILPDYLCADLLADPQFRATPVSHGRDTWLLIQSQLKGNSATRTVIDWIRERFMLMARQSMRTQSMCTCATNDVRMDQHMDMRAVDGAFAASERLTDDGNPSELRNE
jgi:DNA-binding transcriptional LysR family regulator